jgi:hypothetical protein
MPALPNPRHERYAQLFFAGLSNGGTQEQAYRAAGYLPSNKNSANACASRLMLRIANRVRELQEESNQRLKSKVDLSRERVGRRLDMASQMAEKEGNVAGIVSSELGIVKVFGLEQANESNAHDVTTARSMNELGRKLLQSIGFSAPDDASTQAAIEANDVFIAKLEAIRDSAQGLTIDQTSVDGCQLRLASMKKRRRRL